MVTQVNVQDAKTRLSELLVRVDSMLCGGEPEVCAPSQAWLRIPLLLKNAGEAAFHVDLARKLPEQLAELTAAFEKKYIYRALRRTRGHVGKCAKITGLSRRSITDKISQYGIDKNEFKSEEGGDAEA